jgi:hypothetical protein
MGPMNHKRAVVFGSVMHQWPLKLARSPEFILANESDQGSSTWSFDEHEQGLVVLTNSSRRRWNGGDGPPTTSRGSGAWSFDDKANEVWRGRAKSRNGCRE